MIMTIWSVKKINGYTYSCDSVRDIFENDEEIITENYIVWVKTNK